VRLRVARHTDRLAAVVEFYRDRVGLPETGRFTGHDGYDGVFLDVPGTRAQLELTTGGAHAAAAPHPEELLVLYLGDDEAVARIAGRIGRPPVTPANPYWRAHATTFADPDGRHVVLVGSGDGPVEPDAVAQLDPVDDDAAVARRGREGVAVDRAQAEPEALVEAQVARVGRGGRDVDPLVPLPGGQRDRRLHERPADPAALVGLGDRHVLDLEDARGRLRELQVADDRAALAGDEHAPLADVAVQLARRVLGQLEERPQRVPRPGVGFDDDHGGAA
jgi:hypothetical protein